MVSGRSDITSNDRLVHVGGDAGKGPVMRLHVSEKLASPGSDGNRVDEHEGRKAAVVQQAGAQGNGAPKIVPQNDRAIESPVIRKHRE